MQKASMWIVVAVVVVIAAIGGYAIFHKSPKAATTNTASTASTKSSSASASQSQATSVNNAVLTTKSNATAGSYLADPSGKALYTDGSGSTGVSNCSSSCLAAWPPYQDTGATTGLPANVGTIKRSDNGAVQYTYKGAPLYYFSSDSQGQVTGNGVSGFYVATP